MIHTLTADNVINLPPLSKEGFIWTCVVVPASRECTAQFFRVLPHHLSETWLAERAVGTNGGGYSGQLQHKQHVHASSTGAVGGTLDFTKGGGHSSSTGSVLIIKKHTCMHPHGNEKRALSPRVTTTTTGACVCVAPRWWNV